MTEDDFFVGAPPAVSNRNHFRSVGLIVDDWLFRFDTRGWEPDRVDLFRKAIESFAEELLHEARWAFQVATERGIGQAESLMLDPEFYRGTKKRRDKERQSYLEKSRKERDARRVADFEPATPIQINAKLSRLKGMILYHEGEAAKCREELKAFESDPTKHLSLSATKAKVIA